MDCKSFYGNKKYTCSTSLNKLLDKLNDVRFDSANIYIDPPAADSDGDSESSDNEIDADFSNKFSQKILGAPAEATLVLRQRLTEKPEGDITSSDDDEPLIKYASTNKKLKLSRREIWEKGDLLKQFVVNQQNATNCDFQDTEENTVEPVKLFELFWTDTFFEYIKEQSVLYATQNNANTSFDISIAELKVFFAILMISGYSQRPRKDFYWSMDSDLRNEAIANAMSRNRFRDILKNLHFVNNAELPPNDKFAKVRPLIEHLNSVFIKHMPLTEANVPIAVDESMVPYYSHHSCKQRIQGKPIRYEFKFWSLNGSSGYLINTEPYQGKGTLLGDSDLGLGASVVATFATRLKQKFPNHKFNFFIDNFFTGLPLIRKMSEMGYGCTGTIRQNRLERCPLDKKSMNKLPRGSMNSYTNATKDIIVMQWKDNSIVHVASNCYGLNPTKTARRYSAAGKKIYWCRHALCNPAV